MSVHYISSAHLSLEDVRRIVTTGSKIALSEEAVNKISTCREYLDNKIKSSDKPIYGITTGFGSLCNISIDKDSLSQLQKNLVCSHACGTGGRVPKEIVKLILLLKIQSLSYGHSGVQLSTVQRLVDFYNNDILPVIYRQGSLGASGDLSPLAHMSLPLLGLGEVYYKDDVRSASEVMAELGWVPIVLQSKEGLALLNGTQFMAAYGSWASLRAMELSRWADAIGAISLDAFDGRLEPFERIVNEVRPYNGQLATAANISKALKGSEIAAQTKHHVQDPYSFRCMPQVHGASKEAIEFVASMLTTEINSVTDNPTIFPDEDEIISAGNFHGQPIALPMDFLSMALSELSSISERRTFQLISGVRGLPHFLIAKPGLNSGFMIPQYTAASIVSQSKGLSMPASVDSIPSSQGQEDHVSMGANAATKLYLVVKNTERVLAIELLNACQALDFRRPLKSSPFVENIYSSFRKTVPFVSDDVVLYPYIEKSIEFIRRPCPSF